MRLTAALAGQTASFVVLLIDSKAPWKALLESDSCLLPGTFQHVALPPVPTGVKDVLRTSVYQGKWSCFRADGTYTMQGSFKWWKYKQVYDIKGVWGFIVSCDMTAWQLGPRFAFRWCTHCKRIECCKPFWTKTSILTTASTFNTNKIYRNIYIALYTFISTWPNNLKYDSIFFKHMVWFV